MANYLEILENQSEAIPFRKGIELNGTHKPDYSSEWVCPMSGRWKIICIGNGGGCMWPKVFTVADTYSGTNGGATSFANMISAIGGKTHWNWIGATPTYTEAQKLGPSSYFSFKEGFILSAPERYGTVLTDCRRTQPLGYGAALHPADIGQLAIGIFDLKKDQVYNYTIGGQPYLRAKTTYAGNTDPNQGFRYARLVRDINLFTADEATVAEAFDNASYSTPFLGGPGAIILQYLGE